MATEHTLAALAERVGGRVRGDGAVTIVGVAAIDEAGPDEITWLAHRRYAAQLAESRAAAAVVPADHGPTPMPAILCDDPESAIAEILAILAPPVWRPAPGVDPTAVVSEAATLGQDVCVGPCAVIAEGATIGDRSVIHAHVVIGPEVVIGPDCVLWPHVVVRERCILGARVICHPQVTIGRDGYGYRFAEGRYQKIPQVGIACIEDDVEIGAGSCVDRAKVGRTVVGAGTKIDNLVQIAHNVEIGPHCLVVSQTGIAGTAKLGQYVILGGQVGVIDHRTIGDGAKIAAGGGVLRNVPAGAELAGIPARDGKLWIRQQLLLDRLPELHTHIRQLEKRVASLEAAADHRQDD